MRSLLVLPLTSRGVLTGVVSWAVSVSGRTYDDADLAVAEEIAGRFSVALDNAHAYETQQAVALTLQRSLLPRQLPESEGLEPESVYLPGAGDTEVGGDWFDLIPLSTGRTGIVIGDVMGRGIHAAAVMGQLRAATRAFAVLDLAPAEVLRHLDELVIALDAVQIVTCVYAVFDPSTATLTIANAGHLPPLLLHDGVAQRLDLDTGTPLGIGEVRFVQRDVLLPPGDAVVLYTDGLVESTRQRPRRGHRAAARPPSAPTRRSAPRAPRRCGPCSMTTPRSTTTTSRCWSCGPPATTREPLSCGCRRGPRRHAWPAIAPVPRCPGGGCRRRRRQRRPGGQRAGHQCGAAHRQRADAAAAAGRRLLHVEVIDDDSRQPRMRDPLDDEDSGRGLHLVEALSRRWGIRTRDGGRQGRLGRDPLLAKQTRTPCGDERTTA